MHGTRREILAALLGLPVGLACKKKPATADFDGGFVDDLASDGHRLRDGLTLEPPEKSEEIPVLIVGAGIAGLTAGRRLASAKARFRILEMAPAPGGTARGGRSKVTEYPWGAHYVPAPGEDNPELIELLEAIGAATHTEKGREWKETHLVSAPQERVFYRGEWHRGLFPPCTGADLEQFRRFNAAVDGWVGKKGVDGRRAFTLPIARGSDDPKILGLDRMSMAEWMRVRGFDAPLLRWYVDYACRDDFGLRASHASAWYGLHYFASRIPKPGAKSAEFLTWPEGNARIVERLVAGIGKERFVPSTMAVKVEPHEDGRRARVLALDRKARRARAFVAEKVILAVPAFIRSRLVRGFSVPEVALDYAPWAVANVHLADRPGWDGFEPAWDNVIQDSRSLGYVVATHQRGVPFGPTVWTYYLPLPGADAKKARRSLASLSYREAADAVIADLDRVHYDFKKHLRRIDVMRWGHGMVQPRVGTRLALPKTAPVGPLHFAHTDLSGVALFEEAFFHGHRAAGEVLS